MIKPKYYLALTQ